MSSEYTDPSAEPTNWETGDIIMPYEPTNWKIGDIVTSAKLNKIENAVANLAGGAGNLIVHDVEGRLDKTWQEIYNALNVGRNCILLEIGSQFANQNRITTARYDSPTSTYIVNVQYPDENSLYKTNDADGYPVYEP